MDRILPTKKKARKPSVASRMRTATRTVYRKARSSGHRVKHGMLDGAKPLTMLLFGLGGYALGPALEQTGIPSAIRQDGRFGIYNKIIDNRPAGQSYGATLNKIGGTAALIHSLYESRHGTVKSGVLNAELPYAIGAMLDPDTAGYGAGSGMGSNDHWSC